MVGSGPNGLVAAVTLARAGCDVTVVEAANQPGGGLRTEALTEPGFHHDVCSAVHPLAVASPALNGLDLEQYGLEWLHHDVVATHPLDGGDGAVLYRDVGRTALALGTDQGAYLRLLERMVHDWPALRTIALGPLLAATPAVGLATARAALRTVPRWALRAETAAQYWFKTAPARALLAGCAAHAFLRLDRFGTAGFGALLLTLAHSHGWPIARGGSQSIATALIQALGDAGGRIELGRRVRCLDELCDKAVVLLDLTAHNAATLLCGSRATPTSNTGRIARRLSAIQPGGAVWKIDYALNAPLPWTHAPSRQAGTVHLGGTFEEVATAGQATQNGELPAHPFTLVAQPTLIDQTRAPDGKHVAWVYAQVPYGFADATGTHEPGTATAAIERQLERFAPGFGANVIASSVMGTREVAAHNANYVGGDITGGRLNVAGLLRRPRLGANPYRLGPRLYLCSASTPPGPGTHAMAGYHAAQAALRAELHT